MQSLSLSPPGGSFTVSLAGQPVGWPCLWLDSDGGVGGSTYGASAPARHRARPRAWSCAERESTAGAELPRYRPTWATSGPVEVRMPVQGHQTVVWAPEVFRVRVLSEGDQLGPRKWARLMVDPEVPKEPQTVRNTGSYFRRR